MRDRHRAGANATYTVAEGATARAPQGGTTIWQITRRLTAYVVDRAPR